jgi:hypothetical protein
MAKLLGSGSKGRTGNSGFKGASSTPPGVNMLNPSQSGPVDVVAQRNAEAVKGRQYSKQLKKNKSDGIGALGKRPSGSMKNDGPNPNN